MERAEPFVKWAGGKARMFSHILAELPDTYRTYYEPFVGGGAVFFRLHQLRKFKHAVIGDNNADLMNAYQVIQGEVDDLITELRDKKYAYTRGTFMKMRALDPQDLDPVQRAARFLYLNKTCFNGLYRVNQNGQFNTPFGQYTNPVICDEPGLRLVTAALKNVRLVCADFEVILHGARKGDAVYLDPPYIPLSKTAKFTQYNCTGFKTSDHWRLRGCFGELADAGVRVVLSNSSSELSYRLYDSYKIVELTGARVIGGPASYRKSVKELMVIGEKSVHNQSKARHDIPSASVDP